MTVHTYPLNDPPGHRTDGHPCPCRPAVIHHDGGTQIIHNSWDGREISERAQALAGLPAASN